MLGMLMEVVIGVVSMCLYVFSVLMVLFFIIGMVVDNKVLSVWLMFCMGGWVGLLDEGVVEGMGVEDMVGLMEKIEVWDKGEVLFFG